MRSRTEMVTTTFVDSEEDFSDDDDSEEDWRPSASNKNGKKQKLQKTGAAGHTKKGRKRKSSSGQNNKNSKRKASYEESGDDDDEVDEPSEDDYDCNDFETVSGSSKNKSTTAQPKKQFSEKNASENEESGEALNLLVYVKDLTETDINKNNRLCLWRKDKNNLLQKYIRVKTSPEEFIFTSSSVYSSLDDKRISDFYDIKVKSIDTSNRRVKIINPSDLKKIYSKANNNKKHSDDDSLSDDKSDVELDNQNFVKSKENLKKIFKSVPKHHQEDDDDEEEVEEENDEEEDDGELEDDDDIDEDDDGEDDDD